MQPSNDILIDESCSTLQLWTKLQAHQRAQLDCSEQQQYTMELVNLLENICFKWQHSTKENSKLSEQNASLKRQLSNYEQALSESREANLRLNSNLAAAHSHVKALEIELNEYRKRFDAAKEEIQNISIVQLPKRRSSSLSPARQTRQKNGILLSGNEQDEEDKENIATPKNNNLKKRPRLADLYPEIQPKIHRQLILSPKRLLGCVSKIKKDKENYDTKCTPKMDQDYNSTFFVNKMEVTANNSILGPIFNTPQSTKRVGQLVKRIKPNLGPVV